MQNELDIEFNKAFERVSNLKETIPIDYMLRLYAYYKQGVNGDNFSFHADQNIKDAFKFNAWIQLKGMDSNQAKQEYINLVNFILK